MRTLHYHSKYDNDNDQRAAPNSADHDASVLDEASLEPKH